MKVLIYGAGALGQALGCMLAASGHDVDLILRKRFIHGLKKKGLFVDGVLGEFTSPPGKIGLQESLSLEKKSYDYVLITTKSYDTQAAVEDIKGLGDQAGVIVSLQNGCGNIDHLIEGFGEERCLGGRVITGFEITEQGRVHVSVTADAIHIGGCRPGGIPSSAKSLSKAIEEAGHPCLAVEDIHLSLHAKLLYNCALNPLGAILGVHYGALADNTQTRTILDSVIDETFMVVEALGGKTPWPGPDEYRKFFYSTLIPATYNHRASMLQDIEAGKPTEVEALVGYVSRQGRKVEVNTPTCDLLAAMVRFKEAQS